MNDPEKEKRLKRLIYRANHRGIKEMDIILGRFADERLEMLSNEELDAFESLMQEHDRDLIVWFTGEAEFPFDDLRSIFETVSNHISAGSHNA